MHKRQAEMKGWVVKSGGKVVDQQTVYDDSVVAAAMAKCTGAKSRKGIRRGPHELLQVRLMYACGGKCVKWIGGKRPFYVSWSRVGA
jgi:hypothetical protein